MSAYRRHRPGASPPTGDAAGIRPSMKEARLAVTRRAGLLTHDVLQSSVGAEVRTR
ncbi:hypothetical protein MINT15_35800 [Saccharomonospora viridis]|uniref:Uncharacterized protein n=1 Tax=Saccharomonospora viridis TaxID=1852 RepID=A0A837D954_9PSEU|nr:hypothetical protein MINT15_35800 [Saccharomonospora viridis]